MSETSEEVPVKLDETSQWYRDILVKVMGWGAALFIAMVGWFINTDEDFISFSSCADPAASDRALALVIVAPIMWIGWTWLSLRLRAKCADHPAVPAARDVFIYCVGLTVAVVVMVAAVIF